MNLVWPRFHDPDYRPGHLAMLKIHWQANLAMLRSTRDVGLFMLISLVPVGMLLLVVAAFPVGLDPSIPVTGSFLGLGIAGLLAIPAVDCDKSYAVQVVHDETMVTTSSTVSTRRGASCEMCTSPF